MLGISYPNPLTTFFDSCSLVYKCVAQQVSNIFKIKKWEKKMKEKKIQKKDSFWRIYILSLKCCILSLKKKRAKNQIF
jgi:hypothetical protein